MGNLKSAEYNQSKIKQTLESVKKYDKQFCMEHRLPQSLGSKLHPPQDFDFANAFVVKSFLVGRISEVFKKLFRLLKFGQSGLSGESLTTFVKEINCRGSFSLLTP